MSPAFSNSASILLRQPGEIHFGWEIAASALAGLMPVARRAFVVTSPSVRSMAEALLAPLRAAGTVIRLVANVPPEPTAARAETLRQEAAGFQPDTVIAIGGGSVLDIAKVAAALHDQPEPVPVYYGIGLVPARRTRLVCVPTTAGTGSEVSPNALLYDEYASAKKALIAPALVPDVAIIDPALTVSLPSALTATTGIDALTHCLEAYANRAAHPAVDLFTREGVRLIGGHLATAVAQPDDRTARTAVALGSLYGGLALGPVNTAAVHALAYPLGGEFHLAHGLSIALLLPEVVRFNLPSAPSRYAELARALGAATVLPDELAAAELPSRLSQLLVSCGVQAGLGRHGIPRDALPRLADSAMGVTRLLNNNPREVTRNDALALYTTAY